MIAVLVALLALSIPTLSMRLGQEDVGAEPTDTTARQAYDLIDEGFGAGTNGPFLISTQLSQPAKPDQKNLNEIDQNEKQLQQQQQQIEQQALLEGATQQQAQRRRSSRRRSSPTSSPRRRRPSSRQPTRASRPCEGPPEGQGRQVGDAAARQQEGDRGRLHADSHDLALRPRHREPGLGLRDTTIPKATKGQGMTAFVGGTTAAYVDLADKITSKLPLVILVVAALSFLVLLVGFRSLLLPTQAAVMNLVSVGAAYGVLTLVFQEGFAISLIGLDGAIPVVSFVPLIMFAILFGLSTDYQVFLLTQIQEHFKEGKGARATVIEGLGYSGRIIGAAALVMFACSPASS